MFVVFLAFVIIWDLFGILDWKLRIDGECLYGYVRYVIVKPMVLRSQCPIIIGISLLVFVYIVPVIIPKIVVYIAFIVNPWYRPNRVA